MTSGLLKADSPLLVCFFLHPGLGLLAKPLQAAWSRDGSRGLTIQVPIRLPTSKKKEVQGVLSETDGTSENQTMSLSCSWPEVRKLILD